MIGHKPSASGGQVRVRTVLSAGPSALGLLAGHADHAGHAGRLCWHFWVFFSNLQQVAGSVKSGQSKAGDLICTLATDARAQGRPRRFHHLLLHASPSVDKSNTTRQRVGRRLPQGTYVLTCCRGRAVCSRRGFKGAKQHTYMSSLAHTHTLSPVVLCARRRREAPPPAGRPLRRAQSSFFSAPVLRTAMGAAAGRYFFLTDMLEVIPLSLHCQHPC